MNIVSPRGSTETGKSEPVDVEGNIRELVRRDSAAIRQAAGDSEAAANNLSTLMRRVCGTSTREIDNLISELKILREKLQADGSRVQRDIEEYAALNQSVIQLTKIISDGMTHVRELPEVSAAAGATPYAPPLAAAQETNQRHG
jgi:hypothetical protein